MNVGYLVPAGAVRQEVVGSDTRAPSAGELTAMIDLIDQSMDEGALGPSTGLDYAPGIFASTAELAALCRPVARCGGVHASHMRGGYEHAAPAGGAELREITRRSGVRTHVSHFHGDADQVRGLTDGAQSDGEFSFDAYPYRRGCTLLGMPLLPPDLLAEGTASTLAEILDPQRREALAERWEERIAAQPSFGDRWPSLCTLAHVAAPGLAWAAGMTIEAAAAKSGEDPLRFGYRLLAEGRLDVTAAVASPTQRRWDELAGIFAHPQHMAGSDGIWFGQHPHPRWVGDLCGFLRISLRERGDWDIPEAVVHLSANAADTFRLGLPGRIRLGWVADLAVVDLATVTDRGTYEIRTLWPAGIDDVLVAGVPVLADGRLTGQRAVRGLCRQPPVHSIISGGRHARDKSMSDRAGLPGHRSGHCGHRCGPQGGSLGTDRAAPTCANRPSGATWPRCSVIKFGPSTVSAKRRISRLAGADRSRGRTRTRLGPWPHYIPLSP